MFDKFFLHFVSLGASNQMTDFLPGLYFESWFVNFLEKTLFIIYSLLKFIYYYLYSPVDSFSAGLADLLA